MTRMNSDSLLHSPTTIIMLVTLAVAGFIGALGAVPFVFGRKPLSGRRRDIAFVGMLVCVVLFGASFFVFLAIQGGAFLDRVMER